MALIDYQQTDTSATHNKACATPAAGVTNAGREADPSGSAGTSEVTVDPGNQATGAVFLIVMPAPGVATWDDGDWTIPINFTTGDAGTTGRHYYVCDWDGASTYVEVCSLLTQSDSTTGGTVTKTIAQGGDYTPQSEANSQPVIIVCLLNGDAHGGSSVGITPDQVINSPIDDGVTAGGTNMLTLLGGG